jgi:hypothetical protein
MGFGVRIAPGVRVSASPRGLRTGIGPRSARVHVGSGRPSISTGAGPSTVWQPIGGGRRTSSRPRSSLAAVDQQGRAATRAEQIAEVQQLEHDLVTLHEEEFTAAARPVVPPPPPVDRNAVRDRLRRQARAGIAWWRLGDRLAARRKADAQVDSALDAERAELDEQQQQAQQDADADWQRLLDDDPETVLAALEAAFEDNASPAAPVDCDGGCVTVTVLFGAPSMVPERKPATTPSGRPTLHKRTKTERNQLYAEALASTVLATVKEGYAVAPALKEVRVVVVRRDAQAASPEDYLAAIYAGRFPADRVHQLDWGSIDDPLDELMIAPDALLRRRGSAGEVAPLDLAAEPQLAAVVDELRQSL